MRVTVLDDWSDTLRSLQCFRRLDGHDVTVWTDHVQDVDVLAERLREAEVVVLIRERTTISAELVAKLPALRLISQRRLPAHRPRRLHRARDARLVEQLPAHRRTRPPS